MPHITNKETNGQIIICKDDKNGSKYGYDFSETWWSFPFRKSDFVVAFWENDLTCFLIKFSNAFFVSLLQKSKFPRNQLKRWQKVHLKYSKFLLPLSKFAHSERPLDRSTEIEIASQKRSWSCMWYVATGRCVEHLVIVIDQRLQSPFFLWTKENKTMRYGSFVIDRETIVYILVCGI